MKESVILQDLSIGYTNKGRERTVATQLNGIINSGELTCLLGRNGVGKSTRLRTLAAFQPALGGDVLLQGKALSSYSDQELSRLIGVVLTEKPHVRNMTVAELVAMGRAPYTGFWGMLSKEDRSVVDESIQLVGIESLRNRQVQSLSDGERQKVMIAKALAQQTPIIYLSTHDVEISLQLADMLWLMTPEQLHVGTPRELADQGVLNTFIEHEGITFDTDTLTIQIRK